MAGPRILVVEHQESCPAHLVGDWLEDAGCALDVWRPGDGPDLPPMTAYDGALVLGGDMGAHDDDIVPWLTPLKDRLRDAVRAGTPVLGICLGHQLLAAALGGRVARNPRGQTVGLQPLGWSENARADEWVGGLTGAEVAVHWNNDVVVDLPDGAVVLARSPGGEVQVARFAARAWGIQAHPEVDVAILRRWADSDRDDHVSMGIDQERVLADIADAAPALEAHWRPLTERFAAISREAAR